MKVSDFDYALPEDLIAQEPAPRGESRLLVLDRTTGRRAHAAIADLPRLLDAGDLLVLNDTRVFPARLLGRRDPSGGAVECLLIGRLDPGDNSCWDALMHPGQKLREGERVIFEGQAGQARLRGEVLKRKFYGRRIVRLWSERGDDVEALIDALGHVPLPPYIRRPDRLDDRERYQTVYAKVRGSIAAPTAGLHLTPAILDALGARGVERAEITLHVGYGTFKPVRVREVEAHVVDPEAFEISAAAAAALNGARAAGRRIVAVGTTTTRALEAAVASRGGRFVAGRESTRLFIYPGYRFQAVGALLTNFHLPRSSLLMLVAAFAGRELILDTYREAIEQRYRLYSYGDAMLIL